MEARPSSSQGWVDKMVNPMIVNVGLGLILCGALLFVYLTRFLRKPKVDQLKEMRARDLEELRAEEEAKTNEPNV